MKKNLFDISKHDSRDPNPWLALYLDTSIPMNENTKRVLMTDNNSKSVRFLLPLIMFLSKFFMLLVHVFKFFFPNLINSPKTLHRILAWGLKHFVSAEANYLIFRHFHVGTEIVEFIAQNIEGVEVKTTPLRPKNFEDVKENLFLNHDLNLYNFVINLNTELRNKNIDIVPKSNLNTNMITENQFDHIEFSNKWTTILDLRSAIELFTPLFQFFLTANDFVRASNSLQLDETIAIYTSQILGTPAHIGLVNNKHPMVPATTYDAGYNLVLHGLAAESLHGVLVKIKKQERLEIQKKG
ncbi:MAG: hypothetical protein L3J23_08315 [Flavobacteriaceae bacterium]|nr:hypothetical protein [Flavobacteriaceae bacterium]